jgi:hypothetical protein
MKYRLIDNALFKINHGSFGSEPVDERRRIIAARLNDYTLGVIKAKASKQRLIDKGIVPGKFHTRITASGIVFAKAYYDGTSNTGVIKQGHSVVFDTVTGSSVTGINENWKRPEYKIMGVALDNFNKVQPYDKYENVILIKLVNEIIEDVKEENIGTDLFVDVPEGGIPARVGRTIYGVMCQGFIEVEVSSLTKELVDSGVVAVYNISNAKISSGIMATSITGSGTRYVVVESCEPDEEMPTPTPSPTPTATPSPTPTGPLIPGEFVSEIDVNDVVVIKNN